MKTRHIIALILIAVLMMGMTSCVPGNGRATPEDPTGFFMGIWHGWIAPISLIASIFRDELSIYELNNTGFWYDFGFYMAVVSGFGGLGLARGRKRKQRRDHDED